MDKEEIREYLMEQARQMRINSSKRKEHSTTIQAYIIT